MTEERKEQYSFEEYKTRGLIHSDWDNIFNNMNELIQSTTQMLEKQTFGFHNIESYCNRNIGLLIEILQIKSKIEARKEAIQAIRFLMNGE